MGPQNTQESKQLDLNLPPEVAKGTYSNLAIITHSQSEFVVDFARMLPGFPKPDICSRIIMTPENAKKLMMALKDNVEKFESQFGNISLAGPKNTIPMGFGPGGAEA